jgi:hypothetical protein
METKKTTEKIIDGFRKAANELEEFQLQFALGKAEAKDKYEDLKKKTNNMVHKAKLKAIKGKEQAEKLHQLFDELRLQLALGKAETKDAFETQRKKINAKIHEIELYIKSKPALVKIHDVLLHELEKIRVKLEILKVNYNLVRLVSNDSVAKRRKEMEKIIADLQASLSKLKPAEPKTGWAHFSDEMGEAYKHMKAAFTK